MATGRKTGGRKAGTQNKMTLTAKQAFQHAFDELGGADGLVKWAKADPKHLETLYTLYARLIPTDVNATVSARIEVTDDIPPK